MQFPVALRDEDVRDARLFASREDMVRSLSRRLHGGIIAEVGVAYGDFSEFLIRELRPRRFDAYDVFAWKAGRMIWGKDCDERFQGRSHIEFFKQRFAGTRGCEIRAYIGDSSRNLKSGSDTYDMIYVDGDHSLAGVRRDTEAALARTKDSSILIFNDYIMQDYLTSAPFGVVYAVNDLCVNHGWKVLGFALVNTMFCDIALERRA